MNLHQAYMMATQAPSGGEHFETAAALCQMRGQDPWGYPLGSPVPAWQQVIAENILRLDLHTHLFDKTGGPA